VFVLRHPRRALCVLLARTIQADDTRRQSRDLPLEIRTRGASFLPGVRMRDFSDSPAFESDGKWDGKTRKLGVNARLFDGFDAADAPVNVVDGKNLW